MQEHRNLHWPFTCFSHQRKGMNLNYPQRLSAQGLKYDTGRWSGKALESWTCAQLLMTVVMRGQDPLPGSLALSTERLTGQKPPWQHLGVWEGWLRLNRQSRLGLYSRGKNASGHWQSCLATDLSSGPRVWLKPGLLDPQSHPHCSLVTWVASLEMPRSRGHKRHKALSLSQAADH